MGIKGMTTKALADCEHPHLTGPRHLSSSPAERCPVLPCPAERKDQSQPRASDRETPMCFQPTKAEEFQQTAVKVLLLLQSKTLVK